MTAEFDPCVQSGVVPCVALRGRAIGAWAFRIALLQLSVDAARLPAEAQRNVQRVHAEIIEHTPFTANVTKAFPVGLLFGIEVAAMIKAAGDLEDAAHGVGLAGIEDALRPGEEWKFAAATDK